MSTRKIMNAKDLSTNELIYFRGHAKATYMSDGITTVEDAIIAMGSNSGGNYTATTYSQMVSMCNDSTLEPGMKYRITDYVTMCNTSGSDTGITTESAGFPFDLIVTATSTSTLCETAVAIHNASDTHFTNANLSAWTIRYDINNDTDKYQWATSAGKGVIYYMRDEFGNEAPYDFKNIMFTSSSSISQVGIVSGTRYYTFGGATDCSLTAAGNTTGNIINNYMVGGKLILNNIILNGSNVHSLTFRNNCHSVYTIGNVKNSVFPDEMSYVTLTSSQTASNTSMIQNVNVTRGVSGSSSSILPLTLDVIGQPYEIKVSMNSVGVLKIYCEADLIK